MSIEELRQRIRKNINVLEDGSFYYFPDNDGAISQEFARLIYEELAAKNKDVEKGLAYIPKFICPQCRSTDVQKDRAPTGEDTGDKKCLVCGYTCHTSSFQRTSLA